MKIFGNKICSVCCELNDKKRNTCSNCGMRINNVIVQSSSSPEFFSRKQYKNNYYNFKFSEVKNE